MGALEEIQRQAVSRVTFCHHCGHGLLELRVLVFLRYDLKMVQGKA